MRIVLAGPESTGKSALTRYLAGALNLPSAQEYARQYLEEHGAAYSYGLLLELSRGHRRYQQQCVPPAVPLGIFDTDLINYKIWCEVVYGHCHQEIIQAMEAENNHVYLLCYPDLAWQPDPLRENPDNRPVLFDLHLREIERLGRPYHIIRGAGREREQSAENAARAFMARRG